MLTVYTTTITTTIVALFLLLLTSPNLSTTTLHYNHHHHNHRHNRRVLHHPFFPPSSPSPTQPPSHSLPQNNPKFPFSSSSLPTTTTTTTTPPFFPTYPSLPPPSLPPPTTALPTFPANISSLVLPSSPSSHSHHPSLSPKLLIALVLLSLLALFLVASLAAIIHRRKSHPQKSPLSSSHDNTNVRLYPSDAPTSDGGSRHPPKPNTVSQTSSEFLYLGNLVNSREFEGPSPPSGSSEIFLKLCGGSPELKPLPPLPKQSFNSNHSGSFAGKFEEENDEFFSPRDSSSGKLGFGSRDEQFENDNFGLKSGNSSYRSSSFSSPENRKLPSPPARDLIGAENSPARDSDVSVEIQRLILERDDFHSPPPPPPPPPLPARGLIGADNSSARESEVPDEIQRLILETQDFFAPPPPPPPPAVARSHGRSNSGPPLLEPPSGPVVFQSSTRLSGDMSERNEEVLKPKLKALHWDKVSASSDRVMVWDQLKPGSFQLNEEMIETLFKVNGSGMATKDGIRRSIMLLSNEENRVLDPKKSQNISILLRALNVTVDEVCEALLEGNPDTLGTELLESLLKMAPTEEEERKLKEYKDESPMKLGPAEKFLKAVINVPFAFKRVDAMLYMATFDSEVEHLTKSFDTLEAACEELRNSRMFLKLLEAILKTGNRMNVGTNRGDAQAFKLDTLLKLIDVKGTDGKTTLLHFVVQEIIKAEGSRVSHTDHDPTAEIAYEHPDTHDEIELRKRGLEIVTGLGGELTNVKKAAAMDSNILSTDTTKLARGITKVSEVVQLSEETKKPSESNARFSELIEGFLKKAVLDIARVESQEKTAFFRVKELTEYFHGNSAKEEAHPLRIFTVVRDFLRVLDQVCKEVGKINERTIISSARPSTMSVNQNPPLPPFPELNKMHRDDDSSSDDESVVLT